MRAKSILSGMVSGIFICLGLLLTIIVALIRIIVGMAHRIH